MCSIYYRPRDTLKMTKLTPSLAIFKRIYSQIWNPIYDHEYNTIQIEENRNER